MRILLYLLMTLFLIVIIAFTISNTQAIELGIWPIEKGVSLPVFAWVFISILLGFILGLIAARLSNHKRKAHLHILKKKAENKIKEAEAIKNEVDALVAQRDTVIPNEYQKKQAISNFP